MAEVVGHWSPVFCGFGAGRSRSNFGRLHIDELRGLRRKSVLHVLRRVDLGCASIVHYGGKSSPRAWAKRHED